MKKAFLLVAFSLTLCMLCMSFALAASPWTGVFSQSSSNSLVGSWHLVTVQQYGEEQDWSNDTVYLTFLSEDTASGSFFGSSSDEKVKYSYDYKSIYFTLEDQTIRFGCSISEGGNTLALAQVAAISDTETNSVATMSYIFEKEQKQASVAKVDLLKEFDFFEMNDLHSYTNGKDNVGNTYSQYLRPTVRGATYISFLIRKEYVNVEGTVFVDYSRRTTTESAIFRIYGDDMLLYESPTMTAGVEPVHFSIPIIGVHKLKFTADSTSLGGGPASIGDIYLTK